LTADRPDGSIRGDRFRSVERSEPPADRAFAATALIEEEGE
jgi:hypothetical protein